MADLTYNVVEMTLAGSIDGRQFNATAYSGGRAGSKQANVVHPMLANNPFSTGVKLTKDNPGGTLPLGTYELKTHESRKNWIRLNPTAGTSMKGRAGFAIHGRGQRGSDGCIVPASSTERTRLNKAVRDFDGKVILEVTHVSYMLPAEVGGQFA